MTWKIQIISLFSFNEEYWAFILGQTNKKLDHLYLNTKIVGAYIYIIRFLVSRHIWLYQIRLLTSHFIGTRGPQHFYKHNYCLLWFMNKFRKQILYRVPVDKTGKGEHNILCMNIPSMKIVRRQKLY